MKMAAVDKIYGTREQYQQLRDWMAGFDVALLEYIYSPCAIDRQVGPSIVLCNLPMHIDELLWIHCPLDFIRERLKEQYGVEDNISTLYREAEDEQPDK